MENLTQKNTETEDLKEAYSALNRNDIDGFVAIFDPQIERIEFPGLPDGGTYFGLEAVKELTLKGRATWAEGSCNPERFVVHGDKIVVSVHVRVRLKDQTDWIDAYVTDVFAFRNDKVIQFHSFIDESQAVEWATSQNRGGIAFASPGCYRGCVKTRSIAILT